MDAFSPDSPQWVDASVHAYDFCCPSCRATSRSANNVWLNRRSPVLNHDQRRKWQEFYLCSCGTAWWGWSDERPPSDLVQKYQQDQKRFDD